MTVPVALHARYEDVRLDHKNAMVVVTYCVPIEHFSAVVKDFHLQDVVITPAHTLGVPDNTPYGPVAGNPTDQA